jgi:hypothetical protein
MFPDVQVLDEVPDVSTVFEKLVAPNFKFCES